MYVRPNHYADAQRPAPTADVQHAHPHVAPPPPPPPPLRREFTGSVPSPQAGFYSRFAGGPAAAPHFSRDFPHCADGFDTGPCCPGPYTCADPGPTGGCLTAVRPNVAEVKPVECEVKIDAILDGLRDLLIARERGSSLNPHIVGVKRWYQAVDRVSLSPGTEIGAIANQILPMVAPVNYNERQGPLIRMHRWLFKFWLYVSNNATTFGGAFTGIPPTFSLCLKRNVVPQTVGTTYAQITQDSNPPGFDTFTPFSALGVNPTSRPEFLYLAVRNQSAMNHFEVYHRNVFPQIHHGRHAEPENQGGAPNTLAAGNTMAAQPKQYFFEFDIPIHREATYLDTGPASDPLGSYPITNALEHTLYPMFDSTHVSATYSYTSELIYSDITS